MRSNFQILYFIISGYVMYISFLSFSLLFLILGHGGSDGLHAYVHSLDDAVTDLVCSEFRLQNAIYIIAHLISLN